MNNRRSFIVGIKSTKLLSKEKSFLIKYRPWGVILFTRNIKNISEAMKLVNTWVLYSNAPVILAHSMKGIELSNAKLAEVVIPSNSIVEFLIYQLNPS